MDTHLATMTADKYVTIDGLKIRYIEEGSGTPVLFMHGASLGSSADVFRRNLPNFAKAGLRAIAFDFPGYGLSEVGDDLSLAYQTNTAPKFMDALGLKKVALVAHSRSGGQAVQLVGKEPARYSHLVVLGTGGLIPPLPADIEGRYNQVAARVDRQMAEAEPTTEATKKLMQADLFHTELVTPEELALRHSRSIGRNFEVFTKRARSEEGAGGSGQTAGGAAMAARARAQNSGDADLRPRGPRPCRRARRAVQEEPSPGQSPHHGRLQAHGAVGCGARGLSVGDSVYQGIVSADRFNIVIPA